MSTIVSSVSPEEIALLARVQTIGLFTRINPLAATKEQLHEICMTLPALEWNSATAVDANGRKHYEDFIGVSEYDVRKQKEKWLFGNDLTLIRTSEPEFGGGKVWLDYFQQPIEKINIKSLVNTFKEWNLNVSEKKLILAFDHVTPERVFSYYENQRASKEQYAILRHYVETGKMPKMDKKTYMLLTYNAAEGLVEKYKDVPETIALPVQVTPKEKLERETNDFPDFKPDNLIYEQKADSEQLDIIYDLIEGDHLGNAKNKAELLKKIPFITYPQAEKIIAENGGTYAGRRQMNQIKFLIDDGQLGAMSGKELDELTITNARYLSHCAYDNSMNVSAKASAGQIKLARELESKGFIDLSQIDMAHVSSKRISQQIQIGIRKQKEYMADQPATQSQMKLLRLFISHQLLPRMPAKEWFGMKQKNASELIASVPEARKQELFAYLNQQRNLLRQAPSYAHTVNR